MSEPYDCVMLARLNGGDSVRVHQCHCGHCRNEWFVPGYSDEWMPSYCCYCGIKFIRHTEGEGDEEEETPFRPGRPNKTIAESLEELREAGGKAWDDVQDVEEYLGRKDGDE